MILEEVALRKESVDRNLETANPTTKTPTSLSARRAWIEIFDNPKHQKSLQVALRKESVDRNFDMNNRVIIKTNVALRKESVDRNYDNP